MSLTVLGLFVLGLVLLEQARKLGAPAVGREPPMNDPAAATLTRRIILGLLLGGLVILSYAVLHLFLVPLACAGILAYATWPLTASPARSARRGRGDPL